MTLNEASHFFERLLSETSKKSEIKIYKDFTSILTSLKNMEFSNEEIKTIEVKLNSFNLISIQQKRKKHFEKILNEFRTFLNKTYSLVSKNYYTNLSISLGVGFGIIAGIIIGERFEKSLGIALGIGIGMSIGAFIGKSKDAKALREGRLLN